MIFNRRAVQQGYGDTDDAMPDMPQAVQQGGGVDATAVLKQLMSGQASLSAAVRQLSSRLLNVEQAAGTLNNNHQEIARHVNDLKSGLSTVAAATKKQMQLLQAYGRGGGVRSQQYVPARASDTLIAYNTPPGGIETAIDITPASGPSQGSEPVDPGTSSADDTNISLDDAMFHGLIDDDE